MRINNVGASVLSQLTIDSDLDMLTTYQVKDMASPALGEVVRKGQYDSITTGSYTGDSTVNRAIAHGLGVKPRLVVIIFGIGASTASLHFILTTLLAQLNFQAGTTTGAYSVTDMNSTNFYVGNSANYSNSANLTGRVYYWVAFS